MKRVGGSETNIETMFWQSLRICILYGDTIPFHRRFLVGFYGYGISCGPSSLFVI